STGPGRSRPRPRPGPDPPRSAPAPAARPRRSGGAFIERRGAVPRVPPLAPTTPRPDAVAPVGTGLAQWFPRPHPGACRDALEGGVRRSSMADDETAAPARAAVAAGAGRRPPRDPRPGRVGSCGDGPGQRAGPPCGRTDRSRDRPGVVLLVG